MQKLQCELCGSVDIVKIDENIFQCQHCGCKYSKEQVKAIISGEVTIKEKDFIVQAGKLIDYRGEGQDAIVPNNVVYISAKAFSSSAITTIQLPDTIETIEVGAFSQCQKLRRIIFAENSILSVIPECAFQNTALTSITIPNSVRKICDGAFQNCMSLNTIVFSSNIEMIDENAFQGCENIEKVVFQSDSNFDLIKLFRGCKKLDTIECSDEQKKRFLSLTSYHYMENPDIPPAIKRFVNAIEPYETTKRRLNIQQNKCEFCGGSFKGLFTQRCSKCGKPKSY